MSAHTPGPWQVFDWEPFTGGLRDLTVTTVTGDAIADIVDREGHQAETIANARLIIAAPDLLRAARFTLEGYETYETLTLGAIRELRLAIAKAEQA